MTSSSTEPWAEEGVEPIAVVGLACRLPSAGDAAEFWRNLVGGVESIRRTTLEEQAELGVPARLLADPSFVPVAAVLDDYASFDAAFFGMSPREAELRDPQHRLFLELAYTALEDAGYDPARYPGEIGVYTGSGEDAYQWRYTRRNARVLAASGLVGVAVSSHPDYVSTFASYKLNLRGPSVTMHSACSTSLVTLHVACEALRGGECDMALAGGVNIDLPAGWGYTYQEGGINSSDGHCRAFDARAEGTVWSCGGGVVVLRRLSDALRDGDHVRAIVLGNAINNDGATKVGFTAPSEQGQAAVIAQALAVAGVDARSIGYVEAHGTGTLIGDPIEVAALSSAYQQYSSDVGWCAIGSVKTNIGHLGPAAGVAGFIKAVLTLEHGLIPASLHYQNPNPKIEFGRNPFFVNATLSRWAANGTPRRAAVSSFGMGGTNGHAILQEAPAVPRPLAGEQDGSVHLLRLSARTPTALEASAQRLAAYLTDAQRDPHGAAPRLADVAFTLRTGRRAMAHRLAVVTTDLTDAAAALTDPARRVSATAARNPPRLALLFSGQGAQYAGMGAELYRTEPAFRAALDECLSLYGEATLRDLLLAPETLEQADEMLRQTAVTQPALFVLEYALARLWLSWGAEPGALVGHSIGEYVAATLAGVFSLPDALRVVAERGRLMQELPPGAMLAVQLDEAELTGMLPADLSIAAVNGPQACVVSGPAQLVAGFARELKEDGVSSRQLRTSHAFHSAIMAPMLAAFGDTVAAVPLREPSLPLLSNVTGRWLTPREATDPGYWVRHVREAVRFGDSLATLLETDAWMLVECGPGRQLCGLAQLQRGAGAEFSAAPSLPGRGEKKSAAEVLYTAAARVWTAGVELSAGQPGYRIPLPTYPWERTRHFIQADHPGELDLTEADLEDADAALPVAEWFAVPAWRQLPPAAGRGDLGRVLLFADAESVPLAGALAAAGAQVLVVRPGEEPGWDGAAGFTVRPGVRDDYDALVAQLGTAGGVPDRIVHAWGIEGGPAGTAEDVWRAQELSFFSLLSLAQALAATQPSRPVHVDAVTAGTADVTGQDLIRPEHATVAGIAKVLPLELPWLTVRHIDIEPGSLVAGLLAELTQPPGPEPVALRGTRRWQREYSQLTVAEDITGLPGGPGLRDRGVYVITGGLGGIGITLAEDLAQRLAARLVLVARSALPLREEWDAHVSVHGTADRAGRAIAAIRRMEHAGAEVLVLAADVSDAADARRVRDEAVARFGRVDGIVHAAGVPGGGMAEVKKRDVAEGVLRPKLTGTLALRDAFARDELDFVVLCSSITAVAGGFGQVDYCAANNFLDAYASGPHGWHAPVISVNWGSWREVGMAAEVAAPAAFRALQRGERIRPLSHPVITGVNVDGDQVPGWCRGVISPGTHWLLTEHRILGVPVLPGTGYLELARAALTAAGEPPSGDHVAELRDVVFTEPLSVPDGTSAEVRVLLTPGADGLDFEVVSMAGGEARTHARGSAGWRLPQPAGPADLAAIRERCSLRVRSGTEASASESGLLTFGSHWGNIQQVHEGQGEQLALLTATDATAADMAGWVLHPALLDEATWFGQAEGGGTYLPLGYGSIAVRRPLPARLWSHARYRDTGSTEVIVADITLYDDSGSEVVSISDFTLRKVRPESLRDSLARPAEAQPAAAQPAAAAGEAPAGSGEPLAGPAKTGGIGPADGAEAFRRLVSASLGPQVVITATRVDRFIAAMRQVTKDTVEETVAAPAVTRQDRAALGGYVAPRNDLEATIAQLWGEVLGAEQIGVTDDFFDFGGNSLIAVQLISMLRKETGVRLPMRSLFERPTVAGMAEVAAELLAEPGTGAAAQSAIPRLTRQPPGQPGGVGDGIPH
jgi:acyl transferase domain-containing protein/acyl carrier protein